MQCNRLRLSNMVAFGTLAFSM